MDNETPNTEAQERAEKIERFVSDFTAKQLAEHLVDREAEIEWIDTERSRLSRSVGADDWRVESLLKEMYDVMVNNSCAHLWSIFVDEITGMPDLSRRKYSGTISLTFSFSEIEIEGDCADWEIADKIYAELERGGYRSDFQIGYEDSYEVYYDED